MNATKPDAPRIRFTIGPDELGFGGYQLKKGEWCGPVSNDLAREAGLAGRVEEFGFEQEGYAPAAPPPAASTEETHATARKRGGTANQE